MSKSKIIHHDKVSNFWWYLIYFDCVPSHDTTYKAWLDLQDFSKFLDDQFDAKDWVNSAFRAQKDAPEQKDVSQPN